MAVVNASLSEVMDSSRCLPGCRSNNLVWDDLKIEPFDSHVFLILRMQLGNVTWEHKLTKNDRQVQCNLQELEVLKWCAAKYQESGSSSGIPSTVEYLPNRRYACLYPHQEGDRHEVMEVASGSTAADLLALGEEALQKHNVILCPVSADGCKFHANCTKEILTLANRWPIRQIICAGAVQDMIDITPLTTHYLKSTDCDCNAFDRMKTKEFTLFKDIRVSRPRDGLLWVLRRIREKEKHQELLYDNIALHESWKKGLQGIIQHSVLNHKQKMALAQPTRLYDSKERTVISNGHVDHYLALSYCWAEWGEDDESLRTKLEELSKKLEARYFWVDRWCIKQEDEKEKSHEIERMGEYYMGASACLVLTGPNVERFACIPQHAGVILSAFQQVLLNERAIRSLLQSGWAERVWTLQEALISRQVIYAVSDQLIDGDFFSELVSYIDSATLLIGANDSWVGRLGCYRWSPMLPAVAKSRNVGVKDGKIVIIRSVFGGEQQYQALQSPDSKGRVLMPFEEALALATNRNATNREDYIYGVLGMSLDGNKISAEYNITWQEMLEKLKHAEILTQRQLAASTANPETGLSWLPEVPATEATSSASSLEDTLDVFARKTPGFGPFMQMEILAGPLKMPLLSYSQGGVEVSGAIFKWIHKSFSEGPRNNIHGMPCRVVGGIILFPQRPRLVAIVCGTSSSRFSDERLGDTQILLFKNLDDKIRQTVAIKVGGDVMTGSVQRQSGYVMELYGWGKMTGDQINWEEGDPKQLESRRWFIL